MSQSWKLILVYSVIVILLAVFMPRQLDWKPSFSKLHSSPYGGEAIYGTLSDLFSEDIRYSEEPLYNMMKDTTFSSTNYLYINSDFYIDSLDLAALYDFVGSGNNAFIAAENYNREFLDSVGVQLLTKFHNFTDIEEMNSVAARMSVMNLDTSFSFKSQWSNAYFISLDSTSVKSRGLGRQEEVYNYVKVPYESGYFFLHSFPYAVTNYYLMKDENRAYVSSVFSHLPETYDVIWDEYYKPHKSSVQRSPLSVLMRFPAFKWAYWITISGLLLYIIVYAKRRQRPIPIINPPRNESLRFAKTLGGLYYNKGSHKDLFTKKVKVFRETLAAKYYMTDLTFSGEEAETLAQKSGKNRELITKIFQLIKVYEDQENLSDSHIKLIIRKINEFYKT